MPYGPHTAIERERMLRTIGIPDIDALFADIPAELRASRLDLADPVVALERGETPARPLPPFFLPVGTRDPLLNDTRRRGAALRALGGTAEEKYYPGELHAFHAFVMRRAARQCWADTYAFLDRHVP